MRLLVTKWYGVLLLEDGRLAQRVDFPADAHAVADRIKRIRRGEVLEEERRLATPGIHVLEERLKPLGSLKRLDAPLQLPPPPHPTSLARDAALLVARDESRQAAAEPDRYVVQSLRALDEVTKTANTLMERLRDWYALHYPEALRTSPDPQQLAAALAESPDRDAVQKRFRASPAADSIGSTFDERELAAVQGFARTVLQLFQERSRLEPLIEKETRAVAPTLSGLVGPLVAARLITSANGLQRLAFLPASTVQTLGAEDALFAHLKEQARPPKHGVLFQHALIGSAPMALRGRFSRVLATQASIAARIDHFSPGNDRSAPLKAAVEKAVARIRAAPPRKRPAFRPGPPRQGMPRHGQRPPAAPGQRKPDRPRKPFLPRRREG